MPLALTPALWPVPLPAVTLEGNIVRLEPLENAHYPELLIAGQQSVVWKYMTTFAGTSCEMKRYINKLVKGRKVGLAMPYAVRHCSSGLIVGSTRLKQLDRMHRRGLVGSWYSPQVWRTGVNLESKLLLLSYAFETLGCLRIEFQTDTQNKRSRQSLERLGAVAEGVLRAHQTTRQGGQRDSAIYSILSEEWPHVRRRIIERLRQGSNDRNS